MSLFRHTAFAASFLMTATHAFAGQQASSAAVEEQLARQFKSAVTQYDAGHLSEAAAQLEVLLPQIPNSFEAHELLGLVYAGQSQGEKAAAELEKAVALNPNSALARTNLATALAQLGKFATAETQFRKALQLEPDDYDANHNLGEFYIQSRKLTNGIPFLEKAQKIRPESYGNGYDLALADLLTNRLSEARQLVGRLLTQGNKGELHNLLGQIDEKDGKFVEAANEFETAAHIDPSEDNLFVWASELLLHRTYEPSIAVFQQGVQRYPDSPRLAIGLGMALYSRGQYDESIQSLLRAADLNPTDFRCYLFLSKAYLSSPDQADDVIRRFRRYAELKPRDALAQYYYALSLWKGKRAEGSVIDFPTIETLLQKSIALDGSLAEVHLQLGIVYADQKKYADALPQYQRALELDPNLPEAHFRLAQYYVHDGKNDQAQPEFAIYQKLRAQHMAEVDKERAEVQQFVYSTEGQPSAKP